jgi:HPt (histidine-containing phosphotransfer) domain-containing protein
MAYGSAATRDATAERGPSCSGSAPSGNAPSGDAPAFNAAEFDDLSDMIGEDGVKEMVEIFEAETRQRLRRLAAGDQDIATQLREMHTLKGAAGTVAAPRLTALGRTFELAARGGIGPAPNDIRTIELALEDYLTAIRARGG